MKQIFMGVVLLMVGSIALPTSLWAQAERTTEAQIDALLARLDRGESIENMTVNIRDVNFELSSDQVTPETKQYLSKVVTFLQQVENIDLVITGHTDNQGQAAYNQDLSERRAATVRSFLVSRGVAASRISSRGLGQADPIASNDTKKGRAQNRRVEFEIIKKEQVVTIQDLILLCEGDTLGVLIDTVGEDYIRYRTFQTNEERTVPLSEVCAVVYDDGTRIDLAQAPEPVEPEPEKEPRVPIGEQIWNALVFLHAPEQFGSNSRILMLGPEVFHNLTSEELPNRNRSFPALGLTLERGLTDNIGVGGTLAAHYWGDPDAGITMVYAAITGRAAYHFRVHDRIDPYLGVVASVRRVQLLAEDYRDGKTNLTLNPLVGVRFFASPRFGLYLEAGSDAIAKFRTGLFWVIKTP